MYLSCTVLTVHMQVETLDLFQLCSGHCDGSEICQHLATLDEMKVDPNIYDLVLIL